MLVWAGLEAGVRWGARWTCVAARSSQVRVGNSAGHSSPTVPQRQKSSLPREPNGGLLLGFFCLFISCHIFPGASSHGTDDGIPPSIAAG